MSDVKEKKLGENMGNLEVLNKRGISIDGCIDLEDMEEVDMLVMGIDWGGKNKDTRKRLGELGVTVVANHELRSRLII